MAPITIKKIFLPFKKSLDFILFIANRMCSNTVKRKLKFCVFFVLTAKALVVIQPILLGSMLDKISVHDYRLSFILLAIFCLVGLTASFFQTLNNYLIIRLKELITEAITKNILVKLQTFSHNFFLNKNLSQLKQISNNAQNSIHEFMMVFLSSIIPFLFEISLIFIIVVYKISLKIFFPIFIIFCIEIIIGICYAPKEKSAIKNIMDKKAEKEKDFYEDIINFETIKITNSENSRYQLISEKTEQCVSAAKEHANVFLTKSFLQQIILYLGLIATLSITLIGITKSTISIGDFVMINTYFLQITTPLSNIIRAFDTFRQSSINIEPLMNLMNREPDLKVNHPIVHKIDSDALSVEFKDVNFHYNQQSEILNKIDFFIPFKKKVVIVGKTGGGKSTIAKLLMRFYDVSGGEIRINNHDIRNISFSALRSTIGYVPQDIILLNDTIRNNIFLGQSMKDSNLIEKFINIGLLDFINHLPDKLDTYVGDRGLKLSGGQKQRIGIARALVKKPKLLILDEYNSSIDANTEEIINRYINVQNLECTIIIISHRMSVTKDADLVLVIEQGKILHMGAHNKLLDNSIWYKHAWHNYVNAD